MQMNNSGGYPRIHVNNPGGYPRIHVNNFGGYPCIDVNNFGGYSRIDVNNFGGYPRIHVKDSGGYPRIHVNNPEGYAHIHVNNPEVCDISEFAVHRAKYKAATAVYRKAAEENNKQPGNTKISVDLQKGIMLPSIDEFKACVFTQRPIIFNET
ncbi:hypothetical protein RRG08_051225 [Elysia crispata]|uniref:Uncharacterized protein n=1 Tax=Elysia crispata TaxID=231223 RepID=A0AAE1BBB8_9GAST|nr:hypothetical protein RRG08_051225 [Elysia crispata]